MFLEGALEAVHRDQRKKKKALLYIFRHVSLFYFILFFQYTGDPGSKPNLLYNID